MRYKVIPAILEYSEKDIIQKIEEAKIFTDHLHIDIIDESFSETTVLPSPALFAPYKDELFLELHMMVTNPKRLVEPFQDAGFKRFLGHVEYMDSQKDFLEQVHSLNTEAFLAFDLETPLGSLEKDIDTTTLSGFTLMSIHAGKAGQTFNPEVLTKIKEARNMFPHIDIQIDGGINEQTLKDTLESGANLFDINTALFNTPDPKTTYRALCSHLPL